MWDVRQIAYPMWFSNARKEDVIPIQEFMPIPRLDKKNKSLAEKRWTKKEIEKVFGEYYE